MEVWYRNRNKYIKRSLWNENIRENEKKNRLKWFGNV